MRTVRRRAGIGALVLGLVTGSVVAGVPAAAEAEQDPVADRGWSWIRSQLEPEHATAEGYGIEVDADYAADWTGPVRGRVDGAAARVTAGDVLEVEALVVTDRPYHIATARVGADGRFSFDYSHRGAKAFRLRDVRSGEVLAERVPDTGLVRSFDVEPSSHLWGRVFTYDQALALLTAVSMDDQQTADTLARGLVSLQVTEGDRAGAFPTSAASLQPAGALPELRTGNVGFATYALLRYVQAGDAADVGTRAQALSAARRSLDWLASMRQDDGPLAGLLTGGFGFYTPQWEFDPAARLPWASTEHNIGAWHTLRLAADVLGEDTYADRADQLEDAVMDRLWDEGADRFLQGRSPSGPDHGEALDVNSWGAVFLQATGHETQARSALQRTAAFGVTDRGVTGHRPLPWSSAPLVWAEGTAGVALAELGLGRRAQAVATMRGLDAMGAVADEWSAATREDPAQSMTAAPSVAAAAWTVLLDRVIAGQATMWGVTGS